MRARWPRMLFATLLLLPGSCASGFAASEMMARRTDSFGAYDGSLWLENLLWLAALALICLWGWVTSKLSKAK